jgi:superfamily II DNA/RNA helicase
MCDLGFLEPVQRILRRTAQGGQKLLFSATLDKGVATLVDEFLVEPAVHEVAGEDQASSTIEHRVFVIENREKRDIVAQLANRKGKTLVFQNEAGEKIFVKSVKGIRPNPYLEQAYTENSERVVASFGNELAAAVEKYVNKNFKSVAK